MSESVSNANCCKPESPFLFSEQCNMQIQHGKGLDLSKNPLPCVNSKLFSSSSSQYEHSSCELVICLEVFFTFLFIIMGKKII